MRRAPRTSSRISVATRAAPATRRSASRLRARASGHAGDQGPAARPVPWPVRGLGRPGPRPLADPLARGLGSALPADEALDIARQILDGHAPRLYGTAPAAVGLAVSGQACATGRAGRRSNVAAMPRFSTFQRMPLRKAVW